MRPFCCGNVNVSHPVSGACDAVCDVTHSCKTWLIRAWHDSIIRETWLVYACHDWFQLVSGACERCVTWLIHARHDSFIWDMTHLYVTRLISARLRCLWWGVRGDSFVRDMTRFCVTWLNHKRHDSFVRDTTGFSSSQVPVMRCVTWLIHTRHDSFVLDMRQS